MKAIQVYALTVCFAALMCLVIAFGIGIYDLVEIAAPNMTSGQLSWYSTGERYLHYFPDKKSLPAQEVEASRRLEYSLILETTRQAASQSLIFASIVLAIDFVVFAIHWRIANSGQVPGAGSGQSK